MSEHEPVAYWIVPPFPAAQNWRVEFDRAEADRLAKGNFIVRPLYEHPQPTLTDAERALVYRLAEEREDGHPRAWTNRALTSDDRATLRGLLERTK